MVRIARTAILCIVLSAALGAVTTGAQGEELFPRPAELEPDVQFWVRVYTEINTEQGFVHDAERLHAVYGVVDLDGAGPRERKKRIDAAKAHYQSILMKLANGRRHGLSDDEARALAQWPEDVSKAELRAAARRLRFQRGQSDRFLAGLIRSGEWLPHILTVLADRGLPAELAYLPHVESSFNPEAYSHAGAAGLWQFTRYTGRRFMRVDHIVDERMDPFKASVAAARLLAENYAETGSWPLALTGYNHGVYGMVRAAKQLGTTDIATVVRRYKSRSFGFASRNFYVSFLAALEIERNAEQYFGDVVRRPYEAPVTVTVPGFVHADTLAGALGPTTSQLAALNPALRPTVWSGQKLVPEGYPLRIPAATDLRSAQATLAAISPDRLYAAQLPDLTHRVASGETLSHIAARYGTSTRALVQLNGLRSAHRIRAGQELKLPQAAGLPPVMVASRGAAAAPVAGPADGLYHVQSGDTLWHIALRYGISARTIADLNGLNNSHRIYPGQVLRLSASGDQLATLDVYTVRRGDTLERIARRFGVDERYLATINALTDPHRIYAGQKLRLRDAQPATTTTGVASDTPAAVGSGPQAADSGETTRLPVAVSASPGLR